MMRIVLTSTPSQKTNDIGKDARTDLIDRPKMSPPRKPSRGVGLSGPDVQRAGDRGVMIASSTK
jgi:hypothetical protein